jgi:hypothetical protein
MSTLETLQTIMKRGKLVLFVGAGVSTAAPTNLPDWWTLNWEVVHAIAGRVEIMTGKDYVKDLAQAVLDRREKAGRFPPDFQAQIIEEEAGTTYFEVLRVLDSAYPNESHLRIAQMAKTGGVRIIITTNFDRMIERACEKLDVPYQAHYSTGHFDRLADDLNRFDHTSTPLQIIKLHGTIEDSSTLMDTLRQRRMGLHLSARLTLQHLLKWGHWLFLGYSGADLDSAPDYLELRPMASQAIGFTWLSPDPAKLAAAVHSMAGIYGKRASIALGTLPDYLAPLAPNAPAPDSPEKPVDKDALLKSQVAIWAAKLGDIRCFAIFGQLLEVTGQRGAEFIRFLYKWRADNAVARHDDAFPRLWRLNIHALVTLGRITEAWDAAHITPSTFDKIDSQVEWIEIHVTRAYPFLYGGDVMGAIRLFSEIYYRPDVPPTLQVRAAFGLAEGLTLNNQKIEARDLLRDQYDNIAAGGDVILQARHAHLLGELEALTDDGDTNFTRRAADWLTHHGDWLGDDRLTAHAQILYAHLRYRALRNTGDHDQADQALGHIETAFVIYQERESFHDTLKTTLLARDICLLVGDKDAAAQLYNNAAPLLERYLVYQA